jgi:hypothetical protein
LCLSSALDLFCQRPDIQLIQPLMLVHRMIPMASLKLLQKAHYAYWTQFVGQGFQTNQADLL